MIEIKIAKTEAIISRTARSVIIIGMAGRTEMSVEIMT